jgi:hypothetical protein
MGSIYNDYITYLRKMQALSPTLKISLKTGVYWVYGIPREKV